ncbi:MAG: DUF4311 domain-containing protein [Sporomusaceae bacterium]|nr:DUF4311 domain-containing protein [Sporomusaceae bacterium]
MDSITVIIESLIIGALVGCSVGAGAARMFFAPNVQGMGSFRTLGELNACEGDTISHFSFGFGFFFNCWASVVGAGCFTQDIKHRVITNWAAALLLWRNPKVEETLHSPQKMAIAGGLVGMATITLLNSTAVAIPASLQAIATKVLIPAAEWLINPVMPIIFWMAAIDAGQRTGLWGTILGGLAHLVMGNSVPGIVLGILIGKGVDDGGWNRITKTMLIAIIALFVFSGFFRGFDVKLLHQFHLQVPAGLIELHKFFGSAVK